MVLYMRILVAMYGMHNIKIQYCVCV